MIDFDALLYDPLYDHFGIDATISTANADARCIRAVDQTHGIEVARGNPQMDLNGRSLFTIRPVAVIRVADLAKVGIKREELDGAVIALNGKTWTIKASMPKPSPTGEAGGELYLILMEDAE